MAILRCNGYKCRMKNNCNRYLSVGNKELLSDFHTFCNKTNKYKWIMLTKECKNKKMQEIYKKRKQQI